MSSFPGHFERTKCLTNYRKIILRELFFVIISCQRVVFTGGSSRKGVEFLLVSLGEGLGFGFRGVVGGRKNRGRGWGWGGWGWDGMGTGKGTGKSMRKLCRNYPLAIYPLVPPRNLVSLSQHSEQFLPDQVLLSETFQSRPGCRQKSLLRISGLGGGGQNLILILSFFFCSLSLSLSISFFLRFRQSVKRSRNSQNRVNHCPFDCFVNLNVLKKIEKKGPTWSNPSQT